MSVKGFAHEPPAGGSPEWYTPPEIFAALDLQFDLDPCAPEWPRAHWIPARRRITLPADGMQQPWSGRVWLNPPYALETARWVQRLAEHGDGVSLTFTRTDTPWWQRAVAAADVVCFVAGRVEFVPGDQAFQRRSRAGAPSCLLAYGDDCAAAPLRSACSRSSSCARTAASLATKHAPSSLRNRASAS